MNSLDKQIRDRINAFAEELAELVKGAAVESVQEALGQAVASPTRKKASRGKKKAGRKNATRKKAGGRIRRSPEQLEAMSNEILSHIKANPGQRLEQIGKALRLNTADMKRPVSLMLDAKQLSKKGQRRGTTYYAGKAKVGTKTIKPAARKKAATKVTRKKKAGRKKATKKKAMAR